GGDEDLPRGAPGGHGPRDGQRRVRRPHGRGHRRLRRHPPHHGRPHRRVRPETGNRHAHKRGRLHGGCHRDGDAGHEARRRDDDLELLVPGLRPDHPERRQGPLLLRRPGRGAPRHPRPQRRRRPAQRAAHPLPGEPLRPLPRPEGRQPRHAQRRQGHDDHSDKGPEPRDLPRSRRPLRHEGRGRRGRQRRRVRQGPYRPRGLRRHPHSLRPPGEPLPARREHPRRRGRRLGGGNRPAFDPALRRGDPHPVGGEDAQGRDGAGAVAVVRGGERGRGDHPGGRLRLAGRARPAGERGRGSGTVREEPGAGGLPEREAGNERGPSGAVHRGEV
ncbi:MAG: Pyruvate dehydrogenase E1 component beta subunit, partial [uncultured Rubrobacteraceae bacterium]